jgi:hypothetical protein
MLIYKLCSHQLLITQRHRYPACSFITATKRNGTLRGDLGTLEVPTLRAIKRAVTVVLAFMSMPLVTEVPIHRKARLTPLLPQPDATPAELRLAAQVQLLRDVEDTLGQLVSAARSTGVTWSRIAALLGLTPQACRKRWPELVGRNNTTT